MSPFEDEDAGERTEIDRMIDGECVCPDAGDCCDCDLTGLT